MLTYGKRRNGRPFLSVFHDEDETLNPHRKAPSQYQPFGSCRVLSSLTMEKPGGSALDTDTAPQVFDASDSATETLPTIEEHPPREVTVGNRRHTASSSTSLRSNPTATSFTHAPFTRVPSYVRNKPLPPVPPEWDLPVGDPPRNFAPLVDKSTNLKLSSFKLPSKSSLTSKNKNGLIMSHLDPPDAHLTALPRLPSGLKIFARTPSKASDPERPGEDEVKPTRSRGLFRGFNHTKAPKPDNPTPSTDSRETKHVFGRVKDAISEHLPSRTSSSRRRSRRHTMLDEDELSLTRGEEDEDLTIRVQRRRAVEQALQESPKLQQLFDSPSKAQSTSSTRGNSTRIKLPKDKPRAHSYSMSDLTQIHKALNESCESLDEYYEGDWGDPFIESQHTTTHQFPPRLDSQMFAGFDPSFNLPNDLRNVSLHEGKASAEPKFRYQDDEDRDSLMDEDVEDEEDVTLKLQTAPLLTAAVKKMEIPKTVPILLRVGGPATRPIDPLRSHPDVMSFAEMPERLRSQEYAQADNTTDRESSSDESRRPSITITSLEDAPQPRRKGRLSRIEEAKGEESPPDAQSTPRGAYQGKHKREGLILFQSPLKRASTQSDKSLSIDNRWEFYPGRALLYDGEPYSYQEGDTMRSAGSSRRHSWIPESNSNRGSKDSNASSNQASSGQVSSKRHSWAGSDGFKRNSADAGLLIEDTVEPKKKKRQSPEPINDLITDYATGPTGSWYSAADDPDSSAEVTMIFDPLPHDTHSELNAIMAEVEHPSHTYHHRLSLPPHAEPAPAIPGPTLFRDRSNASFTSALIGSDHAEGITPTKTIRHRRSPARQIRGHRERRDTLKQRHRAGSESADELARDDHMHQIGLVKKKWKMPSMGRAGE
ncbi:hypothetical protein H2199_004885 [Coniosporium tulheliwenetii]|uniref:Uncharacterized protein n=1 Tax=Coniosporium tulheliwenetii TaxID=3383036 RepID=A0ACC2Z443_9PEZI|nr:hypothetical protein H2199_004885 [Cladosporium sp. JES 115]